MSIHPTAIIESGARIDPSVEVGPYCVVGAKAVIGERCILQSHVVLEGQVVLGSRNRIGQGSVIGGTPQDLSFKPETESRVIIGQDNIIREHCTIHRGTAEGTETRLGDRNFLMVSAHVGHNCQIGNEVILANAALLGGYVRIGDGAFLGGGCGVHQFVGIGRLAMIQGHASLSKDTPPFVIAAGLNLVHGLNSVGLKRAGLSAKDRDELKRAFKLLYTSGLNRRQALERAAAETWGAPAQEFFNFVRASKRGICAYERDRQQHDLAELEGEES